MSADKSREMAKHLFFMPTKSGLRNIGAYLNKLAKISKIETLYKKQLNKARPVISKLLTADRLHRIEVFCVLLPGVFFIAMGLSAIFAPQFLLALLSGFCISFGIIFCVASLKFLELKRKISKFSHQIEAKLIIDPGKKIDLSGLEAFESKKQVFH